MRHISCMVLLEYLSGCGRKGKLITLIADMANILDEQGQFGTFIFNFEKRGCTRHDLPKIKLFRYEKGAKTVK